MLYNKDKTDLRAFDPLKCDNTFQHETVKGIGSLQMLMPSSDTPITVEHSSGMCA